MATIIRNDYRLEYFFNAGLDKTTGEVDAEGVDVYDNETGRYLGSIYGYTPTDLEEKTDDELIDIFIDNGIIFFNRFKA